MLHNCAWPVLLTSLRLDEGSLGDICGYIDIRETGQEDFEMQECDLKHLPFTTGPSRL